MPLLFQRYYTFLPLLKMTICRKGAVQELLALSLKNPKQTELLNVIRGQGNFQSVNYTHLIRLIRIPTAKRSNSSREENVDSLKEN